jgi:hypothetical protein
MADALANGFTACMPSPVSEGLLTDRDAEDFLRMVRRGK